MAKKESNEDMIAYYNAKLEEAQAQVNASQLAQAHQQLQMPEPDTNLIREQLDLGPELKRIDYLLRSYTLVDGKWVAPTDENLIILSSYGVQILREFIAWYVNKNTLLSNYEDEMILDKMKDCSTTLNELIFRSYEKIFYYPSFEACKKELINRIEKKAEVRKFAYEVSGKKVDENQIKLELIGEVEDKIEQELYNIRQELLQNKLKRFSMIVRVVQDTIHSAYQRAWNGQERRSLRQHMQVTETRGGLGLNPEIQNQGGIRKWLPFGR